MAIQEFGSDRHGQTKVSLVTLSLAGRAEQDFNIRKNPHYERFASFLASEIGLKNDTQVMKLALKSPDLLGYTAPRLNETANLLRSTLNLTNTDIQTVIRPQQILLRVRPLALNESSVFDL